MPRPTDPGSKTGDERRRAILQAGIACLAQRGYEGVRLKDVAQAAGVSIGSLQHLFDSRDALLEEIFRQASRDQSVAWHADATSGLDPWRRLELLFAGLAQSTGHGSMIWSELGAAASRHEALRPVFTDIYDTWRRMLTSVIEDGIAQGLFQPALPPAQAVDILLAHADGCEFALAVPLPQASAAQLLGNSLALARLLLGPTGPGQRHGANPQEQTPQEPTND